MSFAMDAARLISVLLALIALFSAPSSAQTVRGFDVQLRIELLGNSVIPLGNVGKAKGKL